jgi:hypothetical protein
MIAGMFLNSAYAVAEGPIPFNAMMESSSAQSAVPPMPAANIASTQQVGTGHITNGGKAEIIGGFVLFGAGVLTIAFTSLLSSSGFSPQGSKSPALYAGGAGVAAAGVTLIAFGFHKRSTK